MSPPNFLLLLVYLSPVWAWSLQQLAVAESANKQEASCPPKKCGDLTIADPFWTPGGLGEEPPCGSPSSYQVHCRSNTPFIGYGRYESFTILDIFYNNASFIAIDDRKLQDFDTCRVPRSNTSSKLSLTPFTISPVNLDLLLYSCTKTPTAAVRAELGLVPIKCATGSLPADGEEYFVEGCDATVVPVLASARTNPSDYEQLISNGFLLTWPQSTDTGEATLALSRS